MKQNIPRNVPGLISSSAQAIGGLTLHGAAIGVVLNTPVVIGASRAAVVLADNLYETAREELKTKQEALDAAMAAAADYITICRELLKPTYGKRHSEAWDVTGFRSSLKIPKDPEEMLPLTGSMEGFIVDNAFIHNTELNINPVSAAAIGQNLLNAINAVNAQETEVQRLLDERDAAAKKLRRHLTGLVAESKQLIPGLDPRWLSMGFNRPGAKERPATPTNVVVTLISANKLSLKWDKAARAEYYRVWLKVNGVDTELLPVGSPADLDFTIEGLPANAVLEIAVSALNNGGESVRSEVITVQTS